MKYIRRNGDVSQLGGKAYALAQLAAAGFPVPAFFAITPEACVANEALALSSTLRTDIYEALQALGDSDTRFAVRSSAVEEDGADNSFAGQLESFLFVSPQEIPARVVDVWRSGFSDRLQAYRAEQGIAGALRAPAVLVQVMVDADAAGVAFSANPVSGRRSVAVISAVFGLGTALVSGEADADVFEVDRSAQIIRRTIAEKRVRHGFERNSLEGVSAVPLAAEQQKSPVLTDTQVREVAALARAASAHFGRPQDIEWAYANGKLFLLQSRPITTLSGVADPDGERNLWDNSNITESYSGVTTPLTFSFARYIYEGVYRQFCRILHVPKRKIIANERTFQHMLGLIRGRVYYNLLNWYRVLALLPGFTMNRKFMEQMMGVREPLPDDIAHQLGAASASEKVRDAIAMGGMFFGLLRNYFFLDRQIKAFYLRLNTALAEPDPPLAQLRADELITRYRALESRLITHWDAPLINDFFAMIFHGTLRKLTKQWLADESGMLANDLVRGEGAMISMEPARRVREMAVVAASRPDFAKLLREAPLYEIQGAMPDFAEFQSLYHAYLAKFGDRCLEELKLESVTLHDDPSLLLRNVGTLAANPPARVQAPLSDDALTRVRAVLHRNPLRYLLFMGILRNARKHVCNRENLRFERTRLFGSVRRIFLEVGKRFRADGLIADPGDIFYLRTEEIFDFVDGTAVSRELRGLVAARKHEFDEYRDTPAPPDRFETHGAVGAIRTFAAPTTTTTVAGDERRGLGCCAGVVRGAARVVRDPRNAQLQPGCILVAERTDPGWVMLFPAARGLLVERGSLLSHSAIVAREMGIPAVVSIAGLMDWLHDGDIVEFDGGSGIIRKLKPEEAHA